jgi:hypothetical protein
MILAATQSLAAEAPIGNWLVADGQTIVRIEECGGALWGVVSGALTSGPDIRNPDPALRGRPTLGMPVLLDMKEKETTRWGETTTRFCAVSYGDACNWDAWMRRVQARPVGCATPR